MDLNTRLENVSVIGAGGKMGSGIVLIVCREMLRLKLLPENQGREFALKCIDLNESALEGLKRYLQKQLSKTAEKKIDKIKEFYPEITDDEKVIEQYASDGLSFVKFENSIAGAANSNMVFEAIFENKLNELGFEVFCNCSIPCNDGGISLGQLAIAAKRRSRQSQSQFTGIVRI